jgi:predicted transcriptional regulator
MPKKTHKLNVMLTEKQFQLLKTYAEQQEESMAEIIRRLCEKLPIEKEKTIK